MSQQGKFKYSYDELIEDIFVDDEALDVKLVSVYSDDDARVFTLVFEGDDLSPYDLENVQNVPSS